MGTICEGKPRTDQGPDLALTALLLGVASLVLFVAGFGWLPFGTDLGVLAALAALVYTVRALRRPRARRDTAVALLGATLALLPVLGFAFLILAFVFSPGD